MNSANTTPTSREQWLERAAQLSIRGQAFIDGNYADAASGQTFDCISPIDGKVIAADAPCDAEAVERAVSASRREFEAGSWSATAQLHRKKERSEERRVGQEGGMQRRVRWSP